MDTAPSELSPSLDFLPSELWPVDLLKVEPDGELARIDVAGWAFPDPQLGSASPGTFLLNGAPFDKIRYPLVRDAVAEKFWQRKNSRYSGFECSALLPRQIFKSMA